MLANRLKGVTEKSELLTSTVDIHLETCRAWGAARITRTGLLEMDTWREDV